MKKRRVGFLFIVLVICISGCGKKKNLDTVISTESEKINEKSEDMNITESNSDTEQKNAEERAYPHIDISFLILGTDFNAYALEKNMKIIDVTQNVDYVSNAGMELQESDILYADLAKTDYEGYCVDENGVIVGKIVPKTFYNGSLASYLASEIDINTLETPLVITTGNNKVHYIWECNNGYFTAVVMPTDDEYNYNPNYILLEIAYYTDLNHCLWGDNIDYFLKQNSERATTEQSNTEQSSTEPINTEQNPTYNTDSNKEVNEIELEQKLFDSINYSLSIGSSSNCDMSQETLKVLYEKIADSSFFEKSMFSLINEYGKTRYNYEIGYDALVVCIYYDSDSDLYGFDILEY